MPASIATPLQHADILFRGLGDPTRIRIANLLVAGELCVCDIVELLDLPQSTVSRHLGYLLRAGLVSVSRQARFAHYRLSEPISPLQRHLIEGIAEHFRNVGALADERKRAESRVRQREADPC